MENWKTTTFGALAALGTYFSTVDNPTLVTIGHVLTISSSFFLGLAAKDASITPKS